MKTRKALHIAEHLWEDTMRDESIFSNMLKRGSEIAMMKPNDALNEVTILREEIIARWANVIMEADGHVKDDDQTKV